MSVDISKYVDVSNERRSPVWNHMLLNKEKGEALCKLCLDKKKSLELCMQALIQKIMKKKTWLMTSLMFH